MSNNLQDKLGVPLDNLNLLNRNIQKILKDKRGADKEFIILNDFQHFLKKLINHINENNQ